MSEQGDPGMDPHDRAVEPAFGSALRARRRSLRLRQDELADLAGVSERFVYALENGKHTVQLDKVLAVLYALGLHLEVHRGATSDIKATFPGAGGR